MNVFDKKYLNPPKQDQIEICVFGPGYGESIVLHIPQIGWGIIDSCTAKINKSTIVLPLQYLLELLAPYSYPKLSFILLTHPHEDHYKGLNNIITKYPGGIELFRERKVRQFNFEFAESPTNFVIDILRPP